MILAIDIGTTSAKTVLSTRDAVWPSGGIQGRMGKALEQIDPGVEAGVMNCRRAFSGRSSD